MALRLWGNGRRGSSLAMLLLILTGLASTIQAQTTAQCAFQSNGTNYFADISLALQNAKEFKLELQSNNVLLIDIPRSNLYYQLNLCNHPQSTSDSRRTVVEVPISRALVNGTGILTFLQRLGMQSSIAAAATQLNTDPCLQIPDLPSAVPAGQFLFRPDVSTALQAEKTPLAMGEWIKLFGAFYGPAGLRTAQTEFTKMASTYKCLTDATSKYRSTASPSTIPAIAALTASNGRVAKTADADVWAALADSLGANLTTFDGADVAVADWKAASARNVDVLFDFSSPENAKYNMDRFLDNYGIPNTREGLYPFLDSTGSKAFRFDLRRSNVTGVADYLEARFAQPDLWLADLVYTLSPSFNPSTGDKLYLPYWFYSLNNSPDTRPRQCSPTGAWTPYLSGDYCSPTWTYKPALIKDRLQPSPGPSASPNVSVPNQLPTTTTSDSYQGSGARNGTGAASPIATVFIVAAVLAVAAGCVAGFLLLRARKSGENRRFFELREGGWLGSRRRDELRQGITLQDMT
ncbi:hypothetical protein HDU96_002491 [Phlyctochytrium bullatum]|nr:hypothetical protein HDU96_002491 [Phlyctochytrium bullatum]